MADPELVQRLLGQPPLQRLLTRLRQRFESDAARYGTLTLNQASAEERQAIEQLLGRAPGRGQSLQIGLAQLEAVIRNSGAAADLPAAVEILTGPLRNRRTENERFQQSWQAVFERARAPADKLGLGVWLDDLQSSGLLKRLAKQDSDIAAELLEQALRVATSLPRNGQSLSTLAANMLGDAHALDQSKPVATLARKAAQIIGQSQDSDGDREIWAGVGILMGGAITSVVLGLNLPAVADSGSGRILAILKESGEPVYLTLRQLVRNPPRWRCYGNTVFVCENPAVVAEAAENLGVDCAPLVCTQGQPGAAVATLLRQLRKAGARLVYHGDFDWPGIHIGNVVMQRFAAQPWRFDTAAYRSHQRAGKALRGKPVAASWDGELMAAMQMRNRQLEEEQVIDDLLADLTC